jgi:TM2 domain-containing membrane protein YozV
MNQSNDTHLKTVGYVLWIFGFVGAHRFYYGKPVTGTIWFFTAGLLLIGWIIDLFLIPGMDREADFRFQAGHVDYSIAWILLTFLDLWNDWCIRCLNRHSIAPIFHYSDATDAATPFLQGIGGIGWTLVRPDVPW